MENLPSDMIISIGSRSEIVWRTLRTVCKYTKETLDKVDMYDHIRGIVCLIPNLEVDVVIFKKQFVYYPAFSKVKELRLRPTYTFVIFRDWSAVNKSVMLVDGVKCWRPENYYTTDRVEITYHPSRAPYLRNIEESPDRLRKFGFCPLVESRNLHGNAAVQYEIKFRKTLPDWASEVISYVIRDTYIPY